MESTETVTHTLHPLNNCYFINEVELDHKMGKEYWLGTVDQRMWLADNLEPQDGREQR